MAILKVDLGVLKFMARKRKKPENLNDVNGFLDEFLGESDRATAVLGAAFVDWRLRQLIESFLIDEKDEMEELLAPDKPLGSLGARIRASYCMGLISKNEAYDLRRITEIRNLFAHQIHGLSFDDDAVRNECNRFKMGKRWPSTSTPRDKFVYGVANLAIMIKSYAENIRDRRVIKPDRV
jgi:DNA-binding MltR family transcriptional regulator